MHCGVCDYERAYICQQLVMEEREEDTGVEREASASHMATEIRLLIAWSAHKLARKNALTLSNVYADVGPYLFGLSGYRNDVFSYQSRGVIDSNIILMAKQDSNATPRAVEKSLSHLTKVVSEPDKGEIAAIKKRALERLQHRPRPDLFSVVYAREAFRTLVIAAFRYSQQGASYEDIAQHVSPYFPMLVKGGFTYVTYYALVMDALKSFGAQPNGKDSWTLPPGTAYPSGEDIERAKQATWRTEALPDVPLVSNSAVPSPEKRRTMELRDSKKKKFRSDSEDEADGHQQHDTNSDSLPTVLRKTNSRDDQSTKKSRPNGSDVHVELAPAYKDGHVRGPEILRILVWDQLAKNNDTGLTTVDLLTRLSPIVKGLPNASNEPYTSTNLTYAIGQVCRTLKATRNGPGRDGPWQLPDDLLLQAPSDKEVETAKAAATKLKHLGTAKPSRVHEVGANEAHDGSQALHEDHDLGLLIRSLCARESGASKADFDDHILPLFTGLRSAEGKAFTSTASYASTLREYLDKLGCRSSAGQYFLPAALLPHRKDVDRVKEDAFKARRKEIDLEDDLATVLMDYFSQKSAVSSEDLRAFVAPYTEDLLSFGSVRRVASTLCSYRDGIWTFDAEKCPNVPSALDVKAAVKAIQMERQRHGLEEIAPVVNQVRTPAAAAPPKVSQSARSYSTEKNLSPPPITPPAPLTQPFALTQNPPRSNAELDLQPPSVQKSLHQPILQASHSIQPPLVSHAATNPNQAPRILKIEYVTRNGDIGEYGKVRLAGITEVDILSMVTREKAPLYLVVDIENMVIHGSIEAYFDALPHLPLCVRVIPRPAADRF